MQEIKTIEELRREFAPIQNPNEVHKAHLTRTDKIALFITNHVGTMTFFYFCLVLVTVPLFWKASMPFIQYISSGYLQLIFLPLIMVGQNLQGRHAELRAQHDYETNVKAEKEIEAILLHLEQQHEMILDLQKRLQNQEKKKG